MARAAMMMGSGFPPEANALFKRMTTPPSVTRKTLIAKLIRSLKSSGAWSALDGLLIFGAADSQAALLNWKSASYNATNNGATFVADRGFTGDGVDDYIATGYGLGDGQFASTSHTFGVVLRSYVSGSRSMGVSDGGTGNSLLFRPIDGAVQVSDFMVGVSVGLSPVANVAAVRSGASVQLFRNGLLAGNGTGMPTPINPGIKFAILAAQTNTGIQTGHMAGRVAAAYFGGAMTPAQISALDAALQTYLAAVGA